MKAPDRIPELLNRLLRTLDAARDLADRGRASYDADPAVPLAFEALANRVGDLCKQLIAADRARFSHEVRVLAARNRDFVVHHYHRLDPDVLWVTVTRDFPALAELARQT